MLSCSLSHYNVYNPHYNILFFDSYIVFVNFKKWSDLKVGAANVFPNLKVSIFSPVFSSIYVIIF